MLLIDMHRKGELQGKTLPQIIAFAGDGKLRDDNETSREFRELLGHIQLPEIRIYAEQCLKLSASDFAEGGLVLQDIVNQVGKRLGFKVGDGRYSRGTMDNPAYDGVWELPGKRVIVVESKLNAAFGAELDRVARYRLRLIAQRPDLSEELVSILLVVGRGETDNLTMQIRGSRHAWDMRIISVDALLKIAEIKERVEEPTFRRFHEILVPREFTCLDEVAGLFLSTASEASVEEDEAAEMEAAAAAGDSLNLEAVDSPKKLPFLIATINRAECALKDREEIASGLIPRSRTTLSTPDNACGVVCLTSKNYRRAGDRFWFSLRSHQKAFLDSYSRAWVILGCGTEDVIFLIPWQDLSSRLDSLLKNYNGNVEQWHIHIRESDGQLVMRPKSGHEDIPMSSYLPDGRDSK